MPRSRIEIKGVKGGSKVSLVGRDRIKISSALANYWQRETFTSRDRAELSSQSQSILIEDIEGIVDVVCRDDITLKASEIESALSLLQTLLSRSEKLYDEHWQQLSEQMQALQEYAEDRSKPTLRQRAEQAIGIIKSLIVVAQLAKPWMSKAIELLGGIAFQLGLPIPG